LNSWIKDTDEKKLKQRNGKEEEEKTQIGKEHRKLTKRADQ